MVASGVAQWFDLFILTCLRIVFMTRHNRQNPSGRVISPSQRPLPDNTQHSQQTDKQTNIHAPGGIRTHNLSRPAAEDLRLRPRGHEWNRCAHLITFWNALAWLRIKKEEKYEVSSQKLMRSKETWFDVKNRDCWRNLILMDGFINSTSVN